MNCVTAGVLVNALVPHISSVYWELCVTLMTGVYYIRSCVDVFYSPRTDGERWYHGEY